MQSYNKYERSFLFYPGPEFNSLDERVQTGIMEYLEGFGVNEHMGAFIECMSLDKDQRLYMQWLKDVSKFINE